MGEVKAWLRACVEMVVGVGWIGCNGKRHQLRLDCTGE